ncbi:hypothetical protein [Actinoplanes derwentensis]|uniref:Uncharacterized protein n=1 Tax=Actinoplanes derwentensis TaxID=113562 RepID=A0A1H2C3U8_9ACTN|nr:hypothetical protein [Actinoplanes derwentensis]GID84156.1 hypothetical protein Ade03nite_30800 [Actinoplanes derwentensis]SDT65103.1 hypothetical protein SAMN04489716_5211 [Actinoplanes derwentensis]
MVADNPYADQTARNTGAPWLGGGPAVDVDLDGLRDYATVMTNQQQDIASRTAYLLPLGQMPGEAFDGEVLGEADAVRARLVANAGELTVYLQKLAESVGNIGNAARVVANSYGTGDALSAASLNDVLFAYGDKTAPRPRGLADNVGATAQDLRTAVGPPVPAATSTDWEPTSAARISAYQTLETAAGPNGERREILTFVPPGGPVTTTTTIYRASGETDSSVTTRTSTEQTDDVRITVQETFGADGNKTGTTETRERYEGTDTVGRSTEIRDASGQAVQRTIEITDSVTREQVTVTSERDDKGDLVETNRVITGIRTDGQPATPAPIADRYRVNG